MAQIDIRGTRELVFWPEGYSVYVVDEGLEGPLPDPIWDHEVEALTHWSLTYTSADDLADFGEPPLVALIEMSNDATGESVLWLDAQLLPDVAYTLTTTAFGEAASVSIVGPRASRRDVSSDDVAPLLDIDSPLIRPSGRGGDYTRTANSDLALTGGLATIERLIWHRIFTRRGELDWAPEHGSELRLKDLRPRDLRTAENRLRRLIEECPGVSSATVGFLFEPDADHAVISVRAVTDFGDLTTKRPVAGEGPSL